MVCKIIRGGRNSVTSIIYICMASPTPPSVMDLTPWQPLAGTSFASSSRTLSLADLHHPSLVPATVRRAHTPGPSFGRGMGQPSPPRFVAGMKDNTTPYDHFTSDKWRPRQAHLLGRHGADPHAYHLPDVSVYRGYGHWSGFGITNSIGVNNPRASATWLRSHSVHPGFSFGSGPSRGKAFG